ncbi:hypothetical protein L1049_015027 [Liquidambar formosana]|uniref:Uncharacterized protein n=1 Tax=Liquidambar formosana TaxID=63359 RepID=A0AAP0X1L6_LIQFO
MWRCGLLRKFCLLFAFELWAAVVMVTVALPTQVSVMILVFGFSACSGVDGLSLWLGLNKKLCSGGRVVGVVGVVIVVRDVCWGSLGNLSVLFVISEAGLGVCFCVKYSDFCVSHVAMDFWFGIASCYGLWSWS